MSDTLKQVNQVLLSQLKSLHETPNDSSEKLVKEISKTKTMSGIGKQIISLHDLKLKAAHGVQGRRLSNLPDGFDEGGE